MREGKKEEKKRGPGGICKKPSQANGSQAGGASRGDGKESTCSCVRFSPRDQSWMLGLHLSVIVLLARFIFPGSIGAGRC